MTKFSWFGQIDGVVLLGNLIFDGGLLQDGRIDYGEFAAMMRKGDGGMCRNRTMRNSFNYNIADAFNIGSNESG